MLLAWLLVVWRERAVYTTPTRSVADTRVGEWAVGISKACKESSEVCVVQALHEHVCIEAVCRQTRSSSHEGLIQVTRHLGEERCGSVVRIP